MARFAETLLVEGVEVAAMVLTRYSPKASKGGTVEKKSQGKLEVPTGSTTEENRRGGGHRHPGFGGPSKQGEKRYAVRFVS